MRRVRSRWAGLCNHKFFLEAHSFPRAALSENCSLLGTDNVRGQVSEHIFAPNEGYCLYNPKLPKTTPDYIMTFDNKQCIHSFTVLLKVWFLFCFQLEFKKTVLDRMIHLLSRGYVMPVISYINSCLKKQNTDNSLIRHFVTEVIM